MVRELKVVEVAPQATIAEALTQDAATAQDRHQLVEVTVHRHRVKVAVEYEAVIVRVIPQRFDEIGKVIGGAHRRTKKLRHCGIRPIINFIIGRLSLKTV
jgi:hypothetical protein